MAADFVNMTLSLPGVFGQRGAPVAIFPLFRQGRYGPCRLRLPAFPELLISSSGIGIDIAQTVSYDPAPPPPRHGRVRRASMTSRDEEALIADPAAAWDAA